MSANDHQTAAASGLIVGGGQMGRLICAMDWSATPLGPAERWPQILLDLMMPQMNGWEFRKRQLQEPSVASVPVVVMTASRNVENIEPNDVVFKPPDLDRLPTVIREQTTPGAGEEE